MKIIDAHAHITRDSYGGEEKLKEQMSTADIDKAVLVPGGMIDVRKMTKYILCQEETKIMPPPNDIVEEMIKKEPEKFFGFYCVNPHDGEDCLSDFEDAVKNRGFRGLKLAPQVHSFSLTSGIVLSLAELCGKLNVPFYTHVVFSPAASTNKIKYLANMFKKTNFILGHMGFGPSDVDAIDAALENDNLFLETSQGSYLIIKESIAKLGSEKVIFGSEFPMYHPKVSLDNILVQDIDENQKENILYRNILKLISK